jgi:predicted PurR-regulated permease PerM
MNKSGVLAVTLIIALLLSVTTVSIEASAPSLADQIKTTINTVNWSSPQSWIIPHFSLIFTGQNTYDAVQDHNFWPCPDAERYPAQNQDQNRELDQ